jgi:calpain-7
MFQATSNAGSGINQLTDAFSHLLGKSQAGASPSLIASPSEVQPRSTPRLRTRPSDAQSQIRRLKEPLSTRKRSKREEIIILRASVVNGFKFPPWEKMPSASEFTLEQDAKPFM